MSHCRSSFGNLCAVGMSAHTSRYFCDLSTHDSDDIIVNKNSNIYWVVVMDSMIGLVCLLAGISPFLLHAAKSFSLVLGRAISPAGTSDCITAICLYCRSTSRLQAK